MTAGGLWYPHATRADNPPSPNRYPGGNPHPFRGIVLHTEMGSNLGSLGWFRNPKSGAGAHLLNGKGGQLLEAFSLEDAPWAQASGNRMGWISVEHEGRAEDLTAEQVANDALLLAWLHLTEGVPLRVTDDPNGSGVGWHGMGGRAWGNHPDCPGDAIKHQRTTIVGQAQAIVAYLTHAAATGTAPPPPPPPIAPMVVEHSEDAVKTALVIINQTDSDGNGWTIWDPEFGHQPAVVGCALNGGNPPVDGYNPKAIVAAQAHEGKVVISVMGAKPGSGVGVWISAA